MPQPYKGRRVKMTIRLPAGVHAEAAARAAARRWDMSTYIGYCVERTINPAGVRAAERRDPTHETRSPEGLKSAAARAAVGAD